MTTVGRVSRQPIAVALLAVLLPLEILAHDLISGDAATTPLPANLLSGPDAGFIPLDVSTNGRYVLFANTVLPLASFSAASPDDENCTIYRKDRSTDELITVFTSVTSERYYCYGARFSGNGNTVVASPASVPTIPDGQLINQVINGLPIISFDYGDVIAVTVKDIDANTVTDITERLITSSANDIARIQLGAGGTVNVFPGYGELQLAANASIAIVSRLGVVGNNIAPVYKIIDLVAEQVEVDGLLSAIDFQSPPNTPAPGVLITGASVNGSGQFIAVSAEISAVNTFPSNPDVCVIDSNAPLLDNCRSTNFFLVNRDVGTVLELTGLRTAPEMTGGFATSNNTLKVRPDSLSFGGNVVTLVDLPTLCRLGPGAITPEPCGPTGQACVGDECSLRVIRYNVTTRLRAEQTTIVGELTRHLYNTTPRISRDSRRILYARTPINPLGGTFTFPSELNNLPPTDFLCVSRDSIDSGTGVPVIETCLPTDPGPLAPCGFLDPLSCGPINFVPFDTFTVLKPPVLWYLRNLNTGAERLVSIHDDNYFQSTAAVLSADGGTVAYQTRDPRLREDMLTNNSLDESLLPDECFWPNGPTERNLRVITNDNTRFFTAPTQYVYEATPVFCPAPSPALEGQVYAADVLSRGGVQLVPVARSSSSFGWLVLPLLGLAVLRRRRLN